MRGALIYIILIAVVISRLLKQKNSKSSGKGKSVPGGRRPMASDGHRVPKDQDISCRRYGHDHQEFDTPRFIPHEDLKEGYIILNGVRMKLTEADNYENRI